MLQRLVETISTSGFAFGLARKPSLAVPAALADMEYAKAGAPAKQVPPPLPPGATLRAPCPRPGALCPRPRASCPLPPAPWPYAPLTFTIFPNLMPDMSPDIPDMEKQYQIRTHILPQLKRLLTTGGDDQRFLVFPPDNKEFGIEVRWDSLHERRQRTVALAQQRRHIRQARMLTSQIMGILIHADSSVKGFQIDFDNKTTASGSNEKVGATLRAPCPMPGALCPRPRASCPMPPAPCPYARRTHPMPLCPAREWGAGPKARPHCPPSPPPPPAIWWESGRGGGGWQKHTARPGERGGGSALSHPFSMCVLLHVFSELTKCDTTDLWSSA